MKDDVIAMAYFSSTKFPILQFVEEQTKPFCEKWLEFGTNLLATCFNVDLFAYLTDLNEMPLT